MEFLVTLVVISLYTGTEGFQWSQSLSDNAILYKCAGQDAELLWKFNTAPGDVIHDIQWFSQGHSQEMIAILSHGTFVALPAFADRVSFVPNAGIVLTEVIPADSGNYVIEISGADSSGSLVSYRHSLTLHVTNNNTLLTTDGTLHAIVEPQPSFNESSGQWSLVLSCGTFTYVRDPPLIVEWTTPAGDVVRSMTYEDGRFKLHILTGGDYTCTIPQPAAHTACLTLPPQATVSVDRTEARLTLMEARQRQVEDKYKLMENRNAQLDQSLRALTDKVSHKIGFYGQLRTDGFYTGRVPFLDGVTSFESGWSSSTGTFTVPLSGLYFLQVTATPTTTVANTFADMKMNGSGTTICHAHTPTGSQSVTCGTVQHLSAGSQVWIESTMTMHHYGTHFSGFLLVAD